ncbi:MAG: hypothetical protein ACFFB5_21800 [Promethearchaeota archaeon]
MEVRPEPFNTSISSPSTFTHVGNGILNRLVCKNITYYLGSHALLNLSLSADVFVKMYVHAVMTQLGATILDFDKCIHKASTDDQLLLQSRLRVL